MLIHLGNGNTFHTFLPFDIYYGMAQLQRNAEIIQTLYNISLQTAGVGHQLCHHLDFGSLQSHTPCHNQPDISGA